MILVKFKVYNFTSEFLFLSVLHEHSLKLKFVQSFILIFSKFLLNILQMKIQCKVPFFLNKMLV